MTTARPRPLRGLPALVAGQVCLHSCMAGVRVAVPLLLLHLGCTPWQIGIVLGLFAGAPVLVSLPAGRLTDRRGYHAPLRLAVVLAIAGAALAAVGASLPRAQALPLLAVGAALCGAGANVGLIAIQRRAGRLAADGAQVTQVFSWLGLAPAVSNMIGPVVAGTLIDAIGFTGALGVLALLPLGALVTSRAVPRDAGRPPGAARPSPAWTLLREAGFGRLLLVNWLLSSSWDLHAFLVPLIGHQRGLSASAIGAILGVFAACVAAVRIAIPWFARRLHDEAAVLVATLVGTASVFALYPFMHTGAGMAVCAALLGLALGAVQPMVMTALHRLTPIERHGEAIALRSMTINASSALMPLVYGALGAAWGVSAVFWLAASVVGLGALPARRLRDGR